MNDRFSADLLPTLTTGRPRRSPWPIELAHVRPFRIGSLEVRPATREIVYGSRREMPEPRVMQVLVALASAQGEILSREDLIAACWDGRVVSDDAVNRVLSRLRTLGRAFEAFQIETITKVGYRLVERPGTESPVVAAPPEKPPTISIVDRRAVLAAGCAAAAVVAAGGVWLAGRGASGSDREIATLMAQAEAAARDGGPDDMARAAALYRLVLEKDPDNARAWGKLALIYRFEWEFGNPREAPAMAARVRAAAGRSLDIDPHDGDAAAALAMLIPIYGHWAEAERSMRSVLSINPQGVRVRLAKLLADAGRLREALALVREAVAIDPDVPRWQNFLGSLEWDTGQLDEAERTFDTGLRRWPRHVLLWFSRFYFLAYTGRASAAIAFAQDVDNRPIGIPDHRFDFVIAEAAALASQQPADVAAAVRVALSIAAEGAVYAEEAIIFLSAIGSIDEALRVSGAYYFGRGLGIADIRYPQTGAYMARDKRECTYLFAASAARLRADPRFLGLVKEIGLEAYWHQTGTVPDYRRAG